jgi:phenylacetate-CoA ligase
MLSGSSASIEFLPRSTPVIDIIDTFRYTTQMLTEQWASGRDADALQEIQSRRLRELVAAARGGSAFWRERLGSIGEDFSLADLPTTNKAQLMERFDETLTVEDVRRDELEAFFQQPDNLGQLYLDRYVVSHTSGSTGQPLFLVQEPDHVRLLFTLQAARGHVSELSLSEIATRLTENVRLAVITLQRGFYPSSVAFDFMPRGADTFIDVLRVSSTDDDLIAQLNEFKPTHLTAYASTLHALARSAEQGELKLKGDLQQITNISERLAPHAREKYTALFGAKILDDYAMGECLFLSNGCLDGPGMHVNADWAILENVDETGQPVPPGTTGAKVLLTNLANHIQPFIRYEITDRLVMADPPCNCGSLFPKILRVEGRASDQLWLATPEGPKPLSPLLLHLGIEQMVEVREYQLVQHEPGEILIRVEPLGGGHLDAGEVEAAVRKSLTEHGVDEPLNLEVEVVDKLAPEDGKSKFKRVVCTVKTAK